MQGKKSFILYADLLHTLSKLPTDDAGNLFKLILEYVNDQSPDESKYGLVVEIAFEPIKQQLKRDLNRWSETQVKRSDAGKKSAESKKQQNQQTLTHVESVQHSLTNSTDNVTVNVNEKKGKGAPSELEVIEYFEKNGYTKEHAQNVFEYYDGRGWIDKNNIPVENWKYHLRKQWMKEDGKPPLTREEVMHVNNNPPVSQDNWNRMSRSQQHNYNIMHGGSGFPLKDK